MREGRSARGERFRYEKMFALSYTEVGLCFHIVPKGTSDSFESPTFVPHSSRHPLIWSLERCFMMMITLF